MNRDLEIARELAGKEWVAASEWLAPEEARSLLLEAQNQRHQFREAGVGRASQRTLEDTVRRDEICWLGSSENHATQPAESALLERLESLRLTLNRELFAGLTDFEAHFAVYPPGGFYRRHVDRFRSETKSGPERVISAVLYLNSEWLPEHGGKLLLFPTSGPQIEVEPRMGTLVLFMSDTMEHEVSESLRERWSVAAWFRRRS